VTIPQRTIRAGGMILLLVLITACGATAPREGDGMSRYRSVLEATDPATIETPAHGSLAEERGLAAFRSLYEIFSAEAIRAYVPEVYETDAYFRDGFHEVEGVDAIETYFLKSIEPAVECTFDIQDITSHEGNYYMRWVMHLVLKSDPDRPIVTVGMTHARFNAAGKIVFHQDYWDTGTVYERIPILGSVIRMIKRRIVK